MNYRLINIKTKLRIKLFLQRKFDRKFKKVKTYRSTSFFQKDKVVTWYEFFGIKFFEKTQYVLLPQEHFNCRCSVQKVNIPDRRML